MRGTCSVMIALLLCSYALANKEGKKHNSQGSSNTVTLPFQGTFQDTTCSSFNGFNFDNKKIQISGNQLITWTDVVLGTYCQGASQWTIEQTYTLIVDGPSFLDGGKLFMFFFKMTPSSRRMERRLDKR
jgi:hypothetical protein